GGRHRGTGDQLLDAFLVQRRPRTRRLARCEDLFVERVVDWMHEAVDPSEAERFFDGIAVGQRGNAGVLFRVDEPDAVRGVVMLLQPRSPCTARARLQEWKI